MFKGVKKETVSPSSFDVILGKTAEFTGSIKSDGSIRIDGKGTGDIVSKGDVIMGLGASLEGNIDACHVEISGEVHGNVKASGAFRIFESGVLFGDINVSSFVIDEGGVFEGMCHINTKGVKQVLPSKQTPQPFKLQEDKQESKKQESAEKSESKQNNQQPSNDKKTSA